VSLQLALLDNVFIIEKFNKHKVSHPKDHGIKLPIIEELLMILSTMGVRGLPCFSKALFASWVLEERRGLTFPFKSRTLKNIFKNELSMIEILCDHNRFILPNF
jgi:hypothetical protein